MCCRERISAQAHQQHYLMHSGEHTSFGGRRGPEMPRLYFGLHSSSLPGASQMILHLFSTHPAHVQGRHLLLKSSLLVRAHRNEDDGSLFTACGTCVALDARKPICLCLQCKCRACTNSTIGPAFRLSPSLVQVLPVAVQPASAIGTLWTKEKI